MAMTGNERSLGELFSSLSKDTTTLVRKEIELAKAEITEELSKAAKSAVSAVIGGMIAYAALILILAAIAIGLANVLPVWLAVLVVGLVVGLIGLILVLGAVKTLKNISLVPRKTIATLEEDKRWAQEQINESI